MLVRKYSASVRTLLITAKKKRKQFHLLDFQRLIEKYRKLCTSQGNQWMKTYIYIHARHWKSSFAPTDFNKISQTSHRLPVLPDPPLHVWIIYPVLRVYLPGAGLSGSSKCRQVHAMYPHMHRLHIQTGIDRLITLSNTKLYNCLFDKVWIFKGICIIANYSRLVIQ